MRLSVQLLDMDWGIILGAVLGAFILVSAGRALIVIGEVTTGTVIGAVVGSIMGICALLISRRIIGRTRKENIYLVSGIAIGIFAGLTVGVSTRGFLAIAGIERGTMSLTWFAAIYAGILAGVVNGFVLAARTGGAEHVERNLVKTKERSDFIKTKVGKKGD